MNQHSGDEDCEGVEPLGRHLVFTAKAVREAFEEALAAAGGSLGTWVVLNAVSDIGFVSQAVLANHVHLEGATMTHHVDRLESLGLVRRQVDADDRRVRRIELTPEGERLHRDLLAAARRFERVMNKGLSAEDEVALRLALDRIRSNLEARKPTG
jgi:MarR family transcriptional regulator for hemolysin